MTCIRCGKEVVAPVEYGQYFICEDCNWEDDNREDRFIDKEEIKIEIKWKEK